MKLSILLFTFALVACPPVPPITPSPDASDAATPTKDAAPPSSKDAANTDAATATDLGTQVCTHLASIGCPQPPTCPVTFNTKQGTMTDFHPSCLLAATTATQANACGSIQCGTTAQKAK